MTSGDGAADAGASVVVSASASDLWVLIEPWGYEHTVRAGQHIVLKIGSERVAEVVHHADGVTLWVVADADDKVERLRAKRSLGLQQDYGSALSQSQADGCTRLQFPEHFTFAQRIQDRLTIRTGMV